MTELEELRLAYAECSRQRNELLTAHKRAALAAKEPTTETVTRDAALNTLAKLFHNGEEVEGDDGAAMMVDMSLWNEGVEALEFLVGDDEIEGLVAPQPEPKDYNPERDRNLDNADAGLFAAPKPEPMAWAWEETPYPPQEPPGYVLVPLEPTQAMIKAGRHALSEWLDDQAPLRERMYEDPFKSAWKEAIAAAQEKT